MQRAENRNSDNDGGNGNPIVSNIDCRLISTLGYDCIGNDYYSMLFDLFENQDLFGGMYNKLIKTFCLIH